MEPEHALGVPHADITLVEYGSYHCPYCQAAHEVVAKLRDRFGERLRYVFRHRPITGDPLARRAAELAEYAHESADRFWETHDELMKRGAALAAAGPRRARGAALAAERRRAGVRAARASACRTMWKARAATGRVSSPTFLINGRRYEGAWDENTLAEAASGALGHRVQTAALRLRALGAVDRARASPDDADGDRRRQLAPRAAFEALWEMPFALAAGAWELRLPMRDWINDGLLTIFFLVVGLEIKREFTVGRLASRRAAALPFAAALGGMALPAAIYLALAPGALAAGWAIPTTTDTAFAVALIALLGNRVPVELRIFLTAAVVVDDLVAIAIVALFYSGEHPPRLCRGGRRRSSLLAAFLNHGGVYRALPYALLGVALWGCLHAAGLHATLAGVLMAMFTPTRPPANLAALQAQAESVIHEELRQRGRARAAPRAFGARAARARRDPRPHRVPGGQAAALGRAVVELFRVAALRARQRGPCAVPRRRVRPRAAHPRDRRRARRRQARRDGAVRVSRGAGSASPRSPPPTPGASFSAPARSPASASPCRSTSPPRRSPRPRTSPPPSSRYSSPRFWPQRSARRFS